MLREQVANEVGPGLAINGTILAPAPRNQFLHMTCVFLCLAALRAALRVFSLCQRSLKDKVMFIRGVSKVEYEVHGMRSVCLKLR
jgi:hypothetical protein